MNEFDQLIEDTLYGRRLVSYADSCFVTNESGLELLRCKEDILENLEKVLQKIDISLSAHPITIRQFIGLQYILGGYLVNAARHDPRRAVQFIQSLCPMLIQKFIAKIPVFFEKKNNKFKYGISLPQEYIELINSHINSERSEIAATAQRALEKLSS